VADEAETKVMIAEKPGSPPRWPGFFHHLKEGGDLMRSLQWLAILERRWFLWTLFVINFLGSIYGFWWYKNQLASTPITWWMFVPDSPTASTLFTLVLLLWLFSSRSPLVEAFASVTLFKYGIWAVVMIVWGGALDPAPFMDALNWQHWMLIVSHLGMALEAVLFAPFYTYGRKHVMIVAVWTLLNDALDYGLDIHPWLSPYLEPFDHLVGWFTLLLSGVSIMLFATFAMMDSSKRKWEYRMWPAGK
jgi:uncharacterized membrane protein YpjA